MFVVKTKKNIYPRTSQKKTAFVFPPVSPQKLLLLLRWPSASQVGMDIYFELQVLTDLWSAQNLPEASLFSEATAPSGGFWVCFLFFFVWRCLVFVRGSLFSRV